METCEIATQLLKVIAGRHAQVLTGCRIVDHLELAEQSGFKMGRDVISVVVSCKKGCISGFGRVRTSLRKTEETRGLAPSRRRDPGMGQDAVQMCGSGSDFYTALSNMPTYGFKRLDRLRTLHRIGTTVLSSLQLSTVRSERFVVFKPLLRRGVTPCRGRATVRFRAGIQR